MKLMYINGEFTKGKSNGEIEVTNPATEEVLDSVPRGTSEDVVSAVRSGNEAYKSWRKMGANERTSLLHEVASRVRSHQEEIVHLLTLEEGKPVSENSEDPRKIKTFFEDVKAGTIWINDPLTDNYAGPFGGMRYSGGARELGIEGLDEFRETKHVHWDFNLEDKSYWYPYGR